MRTARAARFAALVCFLTILLAACGGTTTPATAPTATAPPATPTVAAGALAKTAPPPIATVTPTATPIAPTTPPTPAAPPTAPPAPRAGQPTRVKIPVIRVDAAVEYVGLTPEGAMDVPKDYDQTAWYEPGPRPGDQGNAAIAGHVDSKTGKAVFWDLARLKPGDEVFIVGDDGAQRRFVVTGVQSYGRTDAPLEQIFGPTTDRRLNLITCDRTSTFDRSKGEYAANVVVYTALAP